MAVRALNKCQIWSNLLPGSHRPAELEHESVLNGAFLHTCALMWAIVTGRRLQAGFNRKSGSIGVCFGFC